MKNNSKSFTINFKGRIYENGARSDNQLIYNIIHQFSLLGTFSKVAYELNIDFRTVKKYINMYKDGFSLNKLGRPIRDNYIKNSMVIRYIELLLSENPSRTMYNIQQSLKDDLMIDTSTTHINDIINKQLNFRRKRISQIARRRLDTRVQNLRFFWRSEIFKYNINEFIYVDESHFDFRDFNPKYGYFKKTEAAEWPAGHVSRCSYSIILAISYNGIEHYTLKDTSNEGVNSQDFAEFIEELILKQNPIKNFIMVMDNAAIHRTEKIKNLFTSYMVSCLHLPPYSPDYNPIECVFGEMKRFIQNNHMKEMMMEAVTTSLDSVSLNNIQQYIEKSKQRYAIASV